MSALRNPPRRRRGARNRLSGKLSDRGTLHPMLGRRTACLRTMLCPLLVLAACAVPPPPPSQPSPLLSHTMPTFEGDTLSRNHFYTAQGSEYPMVVKFFSSD